MKTGRENIIGERSEKDKVKRSRLFQAVEFSFNVEESEERDDGEDPPCEFCGVQESPSASRDDWIRCEKHGKWFHDLCVGAQWRKQFSCRKCLLHSQFPYAFFRRRFLWKMSVARNSPLLIAIIPVSSCYTSFKTLCLTVSTYRR